MGGLRVNYNSESDKARKAKLDERPEVKPLGMDQQSPTLSGDSCCKDPKSQERVRLAAFGLQADP